MVSDTRIVLSVRIVRNFLRSALLSQSAAAARPLHCNSERGPLFALAPVVSCCMPAAIEQAGSQAEAAALGEAEHAAAGHHLAEG